MSLYPRTKLDGLPSPLHKSLHDVHLKADKCSVGQLRFNLDVQAAGWLLSDDDNQPNTFMPEPVCRQITMYIFVNEVLHSVIDSSGCVFVGKTCCLIIRVFDCRASFPYADNSGCSPVRAFQVIR